MKRFLKDIAVIGAGQGAPQGRNNYCAKGIPFVKAGNLQELLNGENIYNIQKVSEDVAKIHKLKLYPKGTILFAKSGMSCMKGYVYVLPTDAYIVSHLACIVPKIDISDYLRYYFIFNKPNKMVKDISYPSISLSDIGELEIDIKSDDQRKIIVKQLSNIESIISIRKKELQKLDELVKARFVEMFNEWKCEPAPLKTFLNDITYGFTNPMPDATEGPWKITAKDVVNGKVNYGTARKTTLEAFEELTVKSKPSVGDVLLTKDGTLGRCAVVETDGLCVNQSVAVLKCNERIVPKFLAILLQMSEYQKEMLKNAGGGTIKHIYITKVVDMLIAVPTLSQQLEFLSFVEQTDKSKVAIQKSLDLYQELFDKLMNDYFGD